MTIMLKNLTLSLLLVSSTAFAQQYARFTNTMEKITALSKIEDPVQRQLQITQVWQALIESKSIPLIQEDSVAFLYRGKAKSVSWMGDFNGWGYNKNFNNKNVLGFFL